MLPLKLKNIATLRRHYMCFLSPSHIAIIMMENMDGLEGPYEFSAAIDYIVFKRKFH